MRLFLPKDSPLINALKCCANCNKESEPFTLKMCPECRTAHYCDNDCQKADRENHQHQCNKDAQKLKEWKERLKKSSKENTDNDDDNDNKLFQAIPPKDDCPICILPLPIVGKERTYMICCGNFICSGCSEENFRVTLESGLKPSCLFCRAPASTSNDEIVTRVEKRMEMNDSEAIFLVSDYNRRGKYGLPKDPQKAFDLCLRAAELGHSYACGYVATFYEDGVAIAKDMTKARKYNEMAVMKGLIEARHNLGGNECKKGNYRLASRHYLISAAAGLANSLVQIAIYYKFQLVTKEEYSIALTSYMNVHKDEYSIERERAAAAATG